MSQERENEMWVVEEEEEEENKKDGGVLVGSGWRQICGDDPDSNMVFTFHLHVAAVLSM